jgi:hypothetical protein
MRHRALWQARMLGAQMCTMIGRGPQSDFCSRHMNETLRINRDERV